MSFFRLAWIISSLFYISSLGIGVIYVAPYLVQNVELVLASTSEKELAMVSAEFAQVASRTGREDRDILDTFGPTLHEMAEQRNWTRYTLNDASGKVLVSSHDKSHWTNVLTGGWRQAEAKIPLVKNGATFGFVTLTASTSEVNRRIGHDVIQAGLIFLMILMVHLVALMILQWWARKPLLGFVKQIQGVSERNFIELKQPNVTELVEVSKFINVMVGRLKLMFEERDDALGALKGRISRDALTSAWSREEFMLRLSLQLSDADLIGCVAIVRINDLEDMNKRLGRSQTDEFLVAVKTCLNFHLMKDVDDESFTLARLNGADFGILFNGCTPENCQKILLSLSNSLAELAEDGLSDLFQVAAIGGTSYIKGELLSEVMMRADSMVMTSQAQHEPFSFTEPQGRKYLMAIDQWRVLIETALDTAHLKLVFHPVVDEANNILHQEGMLRMIDTNGALIDANDFIPPAIRCGRVADLDLKAVELALIELGQVEGYISVNIAEQSARRPIFHRQLIKLLTDYHTSAARLLLEVQEPPIAGDSVRIINGLCDAVEGFGCGVGLNHFGVNFTALHVISCNKVSYIKLDKRLVLDIESKPRMSEFVKFLTEISSKCGIRVIASNLESMTAVEKLAYLGVTGFTGSAIKPI